MSTSPLIKSYLDRMALVSQDYINEHLGWNAYGSESSKCLPYANDQSMLFSLQRIGCYLYHTCPTIRSATEKFVSFVVASGHTYDVSLREGKVPGAKVTIDESALEQIRWAVYWTQENCYPGGWMALQEETQRRYLREGDIFRRKFLTDGGLQVRFIEPYQIQQKPGNNVPGQFGVVSDDKDATVVKGFWYLKDPTRGNSADNFEFLAAGSVQHMKYGMDANDPRGIGPYPMVMCHSQRIKTVDMAMIELALTQSSYAVVRQYDNVVSAVEMRRIAEGFRQADTDNGNEREFGKEVDAKGFKFEFPSMGIDPNNFIAIIDQEKCFIAGVLDMPDFILLSGSGGGTRAGNVSAEGPFARRIAREQTKMGRLDVELLWDGVRSLLGWSESQLAQYRQFIRITPSFPVAYTRDILKDTQAVVLQVENKMLSRQGGAEKLNNDWPTTLRELEQEESNAVLAPPPDPTPDPTAGSARG